MTLGTLWILLFFGLILGVVLPFLNWRHTLYVQYQEDLDHWIKLTESLPTQGPLKANQFSKKEWRYLRSALLSDLLEEEHARLDQSRALDQGDLMYPKRLTLGQGQTPLLYVTTLPSPKQIFILPKKMSIAPSLCTMFGVLGTFVGIQSGLSESNLTASTRSVESLMTGANILFDSMSTAFITSLLGLGAAALTTFLLVRLFDQRARYCKELATLQAQFFHLCSSTDRLHALSAQVDRLIRNIDKNSSELKDHQAQALLGLQSNLNELIHQGQDEHDQHVLIAEMMVQFDDLLSFHLQSKSS